MKIAHISDIHIRNLKFHADYKKVFDDLYEKLSKLGVDMIVNTGDTAHSKTSISPEFVEMTSELFINLSEIAPLINILGNHDLNLMNKDRQDAITPIIDALNNKRVFLLKNSHPWMLGDLKRPDLDAVTFWNFGIADSGNWPRPDQWRESKGINIGLFHGSIRNCVTDSNFRMTQVEYDQDIFDGLDFVMMGDIHKRQSFNNKRIWYAGSLIQQNFGEDPEKGFLLWDIQGKDDYHVEFHEVKGNRRFYTVKINDDLSLPDSQIDRDSRLRLIPPRTLTLVEQKSVEKIAKKKFEPHDVITLGAQNIGQQTAVVVEDTEKIENIRKLDVQERLLREYVKQNNINEAIAARMMDMNRKYQVSIEQKDDVARGVNWRVLKMGWNNIYNFGEGNVIDFNQIKGLTGIFAPNASGKSGLIDVITVGMFDCNTKEVTKNVHLINDNKDSAVAIIELLANNERYTITRQLERVKYNQKKGNEKEWGKTTLDFIRHDRDGGAESLVGELRPQTEAAIQRRFGSFDDFMLTSLFAQWDPMDLIMCKETDRKRILFRFLDLDIFEDKYKLAKDESRPWMKKLEELEDNDYEGSAKSLQEGIEELKKTIDEDEKFVAAREASKVQLQAEIEKLLEEKSTVPAPEWNLHVERTIIMNADRAIEDAEKEIKKLSYVGDNFTHEKEMVDGAVLVKETFDEETHKRAVDEYAKACRDLAALESELHRNEDALASLNRQVKLLDTVPCGDKFPSCQFLIDAFKAKEKLPAVIGKVEELRIEINATKMYISSVSIKKKKYEKFLEYKTIAEDYERKKSVAMLKTETLKATIDAAMAKRTKAGEHIKAIEEAAVNVLKNEDIERRLSNARTQRNEMDRLINEYREKLSKSNKELGLREGSLRALEKELVQVREVRELCTAFEKFLEAMGKDGIALRILTQKLPLINEEINKILAQSAEFGAKIEYDKDEQSIRLHIQYGQYKSRLLELGSGAEKFLASVAIRAALLSISNLPRSNLFIVDEGFGKLDPTNLEAVSRMFDYLKSVFDHVIVISHLDVMKDMVDNIIEITPDDEGYAHVEVGA